MLRTSGIKLYVLIFTIFIYQPKGELSVSGSDEEVDDHVDVETDEDTSDPEEKEIHDEVNTTILHILYMMLQIFMSIEVCAI